jgi:predicted MPP superfamily phosphohydrolase
VTPFLLLAIAVLSAGFAKTMAMWVNWICAQKLAKKLVIADKGLNLLLITVYPVTLLYGLVWRQRSSPITSFSQIETEWWVLLALGAFGFIALIVATIRFWRYRPPACEISVSSSTIDLRTDPDWKRSLVGPKGRMRLVALLPGNEQFRIDVSTKTYRLPRLPACWDGVSIVHLSDFHYYSGVARRYFDIVCEQAAALQPDLLIFSGDLLDDQRNIDWIAGTLGRLQGRLGQFFVLGNHDWYLNPAATRAELVRVGWTDLTAGNVILHPSSSDGLPLVLCGDETPWMGSHPTLDSVPADAFRILVSHTPDNIGWARRHRIDLMLSGHTHGGQVRLPILGPVYSPSNHGCRFSAGVFWMDPTLMYVSRGVSGKEPIRYNCPPEVTRLILKGPESK